MKQELINQIHNINKSIKKQVSNKNKPDMNDPFAPNLDSLNMVYCLHCECSYPENEIKWSPKKHMWVCKHSHECDGAGLGWDIHKEK